MQHLLVLVASSHAGIAMLSSLDRVSVADDGISYKCKVLSVSGKGCLSVKGSKDAQKKVIIGSGILYTSYYVVRLP